MGNDYIDATRVFHEVTKHSYTSVRTSFHRLDWDNRPMPYKVYPGAASIALPRDLLLPAMPTLEAIAAEVRPDVTTALGTENLTRILFSSDGLTRHRQVEGVDYHFRAAASAGALYPIEIYLAAADVDGIEAGLYHFSPADLKLRGLRRGDWRDFIARAAADRPSLRNARAVVLLSAIFWRSTWKYRARGYRYCFWDGGTMLANMLAASSAEAIPAEVVTAFADPLLEELLGIDGDHEAMVAMVALGGDAKPAGPSSELTQFPFDSIPLSAREVDYDDLRKIQRESRLITGEEVAAISDARLPATPRELSQSLVHFDRAAETLGLGETILRRGSTRKFAQEPIAAEDLQTIVSAARHPRADFPSLTDTYLIVNAVSGMSSGAYYYDREAGGFLLLKEGNFRGEAGYLCLEQPLGMDCSALLVYMADLESALLTLGNRGYRDAHLEAGFVAGCAYLAAYSLGRGATGLTFYDDDTTKFFAPHAAKKSPILMLAVGERASSKTI